MNKSSCQNIVIVGTSPLLVLEALYQKRIGNHVVIVDKNEVFGGAWLTTSALEIDNIEVGCHYMSRSLLAYDFLSEYLNLEMVKANRSFLDLSKTNLEQKKKLNWIDKVIVPHQLYRAHLIKPKLILRMIKHMLLFRSMSQLKIYWDKLADWGSLYYPKQGIGELNNRLKSKLKESDIEIIHDEIQTANAKKNGVELNLKQQDLTFDKIIMGQNVHIDVAVNDNQILTDKQKKEFVHISYLIKGTKKREFSCIQKMGVDLHKNLESNLIMRIADVGKYYLPKESVNLVICCQITKSVFDEENIVNRVFEAIKKLTLISEDSEILDYHTDFYSSSWISKSKYEDVISNLPSNIKILATEDLAYGIDRYFDKWKILLK